MEDLYGTAPSSGTGMGSESEDITNILNQLLQSSSPSSSLSPFSSAPSSSSSFTAFKAKYTHSLNSPPPQPQQQTPSFSDAATISGLFASEERLRFGRSENQTEPEPSTAAGSSGFGFSDPSGGFFGAEVKDGAAENALSKGRRISPENDFGDFSCDSEGPEASDVPSNSVQPPRNSSKRSRAAEVHNLSEKRRRSRINEKMKALQNLIPNSNKTDKASMLDEAIEYLKQLQLQVQMLSMRNGLSLHPMCLPGVLQPMQLPLSQTGLGFNEGIKFPNPGIGISTSGNEETVTQSPYSLPNSCNISNQPLVLSSLPNVPNPETSLRFEPSTQTHFRPVNLTPSSTELCDKGILLGKSDTLPAKSPDV